MCPSRKNMFSVMSNAGFGGTSMMSSNGTLIYVPTKGIVKSGNRVGIVKKAWQKRIKDLTLENAQWLFERGCTVTVA